MEQRYKSYEEILKLEPLEFCQYLDQYRTMFLDIVETTADVQLASLELQKVASNYVIVSTLMSYARVYKRMYKNEGLKKEYDDMVDKEKSISDTLSAIDMQYKAINRIIVLHCENQKELYLTGAM